VFYMTFDSLAMMFGIDAQRPAKRRALASPVEATFFVAGTYLSGLLGDTLQRPLIH